jgi:hypothetical protein
MDFKQNINKIDNELKKLFENVYITEKAEKGNFYVEITANKLFLFEACKKRVEVKAQINKNELNKNIINWSYSINPLNENAEKIQKTSYLSGIANDIFDIASNKRMVKEYFSNLESQVDLINENYTDISTNANIFTKISNILTKYGKFNKIVGNIQNGKGFYNAFPEKELSMSEKFSIEKELNSLDDVSFVSFPDNQIKITI